MALFPGRVQHRHLPSAAGDAVAVEAVKVPGQLKHDRTRRLELEYNPRGTFIKSVTVIHERGLGKEMVLEVWHVRNICQRYLYETVSGLKVKVNIAIPFERAG